MVIKSEKQLSNEYKQIENNIYQLEAFKKHCEISAINYEQVRKVIKCVMQNLQSA